MQPVRVNLGPRSYDVVSGPGDFAAFVARVAPSARRLFLANDESVAGHAGALAAALQAGGLGVTRFAVPSGEGSKSLAMAARLYDALAAMPADRSTPVAAVGGGVTGDLAGFAAATYNRGLPLIMVPTTLLAMVDSSVGGKVGVNHAAGKNLIGAFHQPAGVWIDPTFLATLPDREFRSGLGEVVKYGVSFDSQFFESLESNVAAILARDPVTISHIVAWCCRLKAGVVELDEREETGLRAKLNYGHTFAHAFEAVGGYGAWLHGEAVAAGMVHASRLAEKLGRISPDVTARQRDLLGAFGLPTRADPGWPTDALVGAMRRDKKSLGGSLRFVLPTGLGGVELVDGVPESLVREALGPCP